MFKNINIFTRALFQGFVLEPLIKTGGVSAIQIEQALLHCAQLALPLNKIGGVSAIQIEQALCIALNPYITFK